MGSESRVGAALPWLGVVLVAAAVGTSLQPSHGLEGAYFSNPRWEGHPHVSRVDPAITSAVLAHPPATVWQQFSVEWTGTLFVWRPGEYSIATRSDDGSEVFLDEQPVVDNAGAHRVQLRAARLRLEAGAHPIRVRYAQLGERYACDLLWAFEGGGLEPIPTLALLPGARSTATAVASYALPWLAPAIVLVVGHRTLRRRARRMHVAGGPTWWVRFSDALAHPGPALLTIWCAGGLLRLAALVAGRPVIWPDSLVFYATAADILHGHVTSHDAYRTLAYPFLVVASLQMTPEGWAWTALTVVQHVFGLVAATIWYWLGRRVFTPGVALGGAFLFAVHGVTVFYEASILTEALFTLVLAGVCWAAARLVTTPTIGRAVIAGLACGALILVRPVAQWYVAAVVVALSCAAAPRRTRAVTGVVAVASCLVAVWPMTEINRREFGFRGVALGRGLGLYTRVFEVDALAPPELSTEPMVQELWGVAQALGWPASRVRDTLDYDRGLSSAEADERMYRLALETIAEHPLAYAVGTLRQWILQVADPERGAVWCSAGVTSYPCSGSGDESQVPFRFRTPPASPLRPVVTAYLVHAVAPMPVVLALAVLGAASLLVARWRDPLRAESVLLVSTAVYFTLVPALSQWPQDRYRLPVDAVWFMLALHGARASAPPPMAVNDTRAT